MSEQDEIVAGLMRLNNEWWTLAQRAMHGPHADLVRRFLAGRITWNPYMHELWDANLNADLI